MDIATTAMALRLMQNTGNTNHATASGQRANKQMSKVIINYVKSEVENERLKLTLANGYGKYPHVRILSIFGILAIDISPYNREVRLQMLDGTNFVLQPDNSLEDENREKAWDHLCKLIHTI